MDISTTLYTVTALGDTKIHGEYGKGGEGIVLRKGRDVRRCGGSDEMVAV